MVEGPVRGDGYSLINRFKLSNPLVQSKVEKNFIFVKLFNISCVVIFYIFIKLKNCVQKIKEYFTSSLQRILFEERNCRGRNVRH